MIRSKSDSDIRSCDEMLTNPRRAVTAEKYNPTDTATGITSTKIAKTEEEMKQIRSSLKSIFLFGSLSTSDISEVIQYMFARDIKENDEVITQDETGDYFYIIAKGKFAAYQNNLVVKNYDGSGYFGELSLMYNTPRSATIKALTNGKLWALDSNSFRRFLSQHAYERRKKLDNLVKQVNNLSNLPKMEMLMLIDSLALVNFYNQTILNEKSMCNKFYLIEIGCVDISVNNVIKTTLKVGDFFGDESILFNKESSFTAKANGHVSLGYIEFESFKIIFMPILSEMQARCTEFIKSIS